MMEHAGAFNDVKIHPDLIDVQDVAIEVVNVVNAQFLTFSACVSKAG